MPWFIASLLGGLKFAASSIAIQVLVGLGIGVLTMNGIDTTFDWLIAQAVQRFDGLPIEVVQAIAYMRVGEFIGIITGAMTMRFSMTAIRTAAGGLAIKRFLKL